MQNELTADEQSHVIYSMYTGNQTAASISEIAEASKKVIEKWRSEHQPVRILIDASKILGQDAGARKVARDAMEMLDYDKLAIFGASRMIKYIAIFLIQVSNKQEKARYFDTKEEALAWLTA